MYRCSPGCSASNRPPEIPAPPVSMREGRKGGKTAWISYWTP
ncbi:hypothetical protein CLOM621_05051 [Clostridium sp. M62/1]|nr:hypothetical protein CLOM621_05051 [Clostridium sp. M62/1]